MFSAKFGIETCTRILDLGGTVFNWRLMTQKPLVTMLNIANGPGVTECSDPQFKMVFYEGGKAPFPDMSFDVCYSNSVIEHVGNSHAIKLFSGEIRRLAPRYYVQTPNRWFFVEPHFICVFIHWLPFGVKRRLIRWLSVWGLVTKPDQATVDKFLTSINLLTVQQMTELFDDAVIIKERFLGFTKSIVAIKF